MRAYFAMRGVAAVGLVALAVLIGAAPKANAQDVTLEVWSHEADEPAKVAFRELAAKNFEKSHPGAKVKITWYEKNPLFAALKTALPAGKGPDVFYLEPDQTEYITAGYIVPLDDLGELEQHRAVGAQGLDPQRQDLRHSAGGLHRRALLQQGHAEDSSASTLPANAQFTQAQFLDLVKKARAAGMTPIAQGVGDRPYPGAYITVEALLRKLGPDDYQKLFTGKLSFADPRVVEVLKWVKELVDAGAYPKNFMTLKLGESHYYFYSKPGALMLPMGSFYTGRAFVPEDKGGQPQTSRSASCSSPRWTAAPATSARRRPSARASPSTPRASTRSWPRSSSTRCRRPRWARCGSRPSICRRASRRT